MPNLYSIIKKLQNTKGTKAKGEILTENEENSFLKQFLYFTYEPTHNFFMAKLPEDALYGVYDQSYCDNDFEVIHNILRQLKERHVTGHAAKDAVITAARQLTEEGFELLRYALERDIKAGVGEKSINKVFPALLTIIPYQRCVLPKDSDIINWAWGQPGFDAYSQIKADGMYGNVNVRLDTSAISPKRDVHITSRAGTIFPDSPAFSQLREEAKATSERMGRDIQIHGEMLVIINGVTQAREVGNGMLNSMIQTGDALPPGTTVKFVAWDIIPLEEAVSGGRFDIAYRDRLSTLIQSVPAFAKAIEIVETRKITTYREAMEHFTDALHRGLEGTVVKHGDAPWLDGNNALQVKGKLEFEVEMRITGYTVGQGKHALTFGSIESESEDGQVGVGVSGMTDKLREEISANRAYYMGKIITVRANDILLAKEPGELHSLFLPRLVEVRLDKTVANTYNEIVVAKEEAKTSAKLAKDKE